MPLNAKATQEFVPIKNVRDDILILKDGGLRAVLMCSSINLMLKSQEEQEAIIMQFQNFLNSLDFSIQILIQSRKLDIRPYLLQLENQMKTQVEPLIKFQTNEYINFIRKFTEDNEIMTKSFFVVIPYTASLLNSKGSANPFSGIFGGSKKPGETKKQSEAAEFEEKRTQLDQRVNVVMNGLQSLDIHSRQLQTQDIIELLFKTFNPGDVSHGIDLAALK